MTLADFFVLCCFLLGSISAVLVAFHPNVLYAAIALVFSLLSVGGLYAAMGADFLAGVQLIIYVGGIIVVILFAIMMSENIYRRKFLDMARGFVMPSVVALVLLAGLLRLVRSTPWGESGEPLKYLPTSEPLGRALVGPYALVFQYVAIVLLAGLIGAVVVARPHYHDHDDQKGRE